MAKHIVWGLLATLMSAPLMAQQPPTRSPPPVAAPPAASLPVVEFAFEERATLSPAVVVGETALGRRQYIPITGGTVTGPKFKGEIIPGGWDYQLTSASGCNALSADYFLKAEDGTVIHILNQALMCPGDSPEAGRTYVHPQFEAPKGKYEWMTRATFVGTLETETAAAAPGAAPVLKAVRIKFYQIK